MQDIVCEQIALFEQSLKAWVGAIIVLHFSNRSTGMVSSFMTVFSSSDFCTLCPQWLTCQICIYPIHFLTLDHTSYLQNLPCNKIWSVHFTLKGRKVFALLSQLSHNISPVTTSLTCALTISHLSPDAQYHNISTLTRCTYLIASLAFASHLISINASPH